MALCFTCSFHSSLLLSPKSNRKPPSASPLHFSQSSKPSIARCLPHSTTPNSLISHSPKHIFLPLLEDQEEEEENEEEEQTHQREQQYIEDPILKFFISRSGKQTQDSNYEGRTILQKNRRWVWRLADMDSEEPDIEVEEYKEDFDSGVSNSSPGVKGILGEILQIAKNVPENSTLGELLESYEGKIGEDECVEMLSLMEEEGLVMGCLYFFEWMGLQEPSLVMPKACSVMFTVLGRAGLGEKLMVLYRNLPTTMDFRDVRVYNSAISGLSCCGRFDDAWEVYEAMETNNIQLDHVTCSILITVTRRSGRSAKDAWELFERMNRKGVKWSLEVMGALIKSFCDEGLKDEALIIQSEMEKKGVSSNTIIYNTLMDVYSKDNQIEEAEGLFLEMKERGLKPTSVTYNILMDAYSRRMQPEIIEDLLQEMQDGGLEPNVKSYTCLISAYGRKRMSDKAADVFLKMKKVGIKPTSHSYTALIHAYSVDGWHEKASFAFENMKREGVRPSVETYTALLDAFRRAGDTRTLMGIWKLMTEDKIEGTQVTFNTLLDGFAKQGQYSEARDVVSEFGRIGLQPTVMTYNMLMNAYARGGQHSKLPQLLKEMAVLNLKPDSITYSTMIYAYVRVRDFSRAFYYHKQMVKSKQVPDARSYQKLRNILDIKAALKNRKDKSAILGIINSSMGMLKEKRKTKKDEFWKNKTKRSASSTRHQ